MDIEIAAEDIKLDEACETIFIDPDDLICSEDEYELAEENLLVSEVDSGSPIVCVWSNWNI